MNAKYMISLLVMVLAVPVFAAEGQAVNDSPATYVVIPIEGTIGMEMTNELLGRCLDAARRAKPTVVVLQIDSGGGSMPVLVDMLATLDEYVDLRIVAYVERAISAAALLTMACEEIIIDPKGTIGACVIYRADLAGSPANIREKQESIQRARFRAVASAAGHDPLLIEGMMRTDIALRLLQEDGQPKIVEGVKGKASAGTILKRAGRILTLTGQAAVECGLALGMADKLDKANELLGVDRWEESSKAPRVLCLMRKQKVQKARKLYKGAVLRACRLQERADRLNDKQIRQQIALLKSAERCLATAAAIAGRHPKLDLVVSEAGDQAAGGDLAPLVEAVTKQREALEAKLPSSSRSRKRAKPKLGSTKIVWTPDSVKEAKPDD